MSTRSFIRKASTVVVIVAAVRFYLKLRKKMQAFKREKMILKQLPCLPLPPGQQHRLDLFGAVKRKLPKNTPFTLETVPKHFLAAAKKIFQDLPNDGIVALWVINPDVFPIPVAHVLIKDMKLARELLSTKMLPFLKKGSAYRSSSDLIGNGVLSTSGDVWHRQRIIIERGFTNTLLQKQFPMIEQTAEDLINRFKMLLNQGSRADILNSTVEIDLIEEMMKATLDVLGRTAFSYDIGSLKCRETKDAPLYEAFEVILSTLQQWVLNPILFQTRNILPTKQNKDFKRCMKRLDDVIEDIITARESQMQDKEFSKQPRDLLDILLQSDVQQDDQIQMNKTEIMDNMRTILFAGHDTTAAALTWSFYLLAKHPEVSAKILEEFDEVLGGEITFENIESSEYLNAVILEVLRLYPSAGFSREPTEDIYLGKHLIPKGTEIFIFPYLIQRDEKYFENADEFIPERWINQNKEKIGLQARFAKATMSEAYLPFSLGKRNCAGRKLALLEIRVLILNVLKNFHLELPEKQPENFQEIPYMGITAFPKDVHVSIKLRE